MNMHCFGQLLLQSMTENCNGEEGKLFKILYGTVRNARFERTQLINPNASNARGATID